MSVNDEYRAEYMRAARVIEALYEDWQSGPSAKDEDGWYFHTGLFDLLVRDQAMTVGETDSSKTNGARVRREHVVPRLVLAKRCMEMFGEGKTREDVAEFLRQFLKIVRVSAEEAAAIDAHALQQKKTMPIENWWLSAENVFIRLTRANVKFTPF